MRPKAIVVHTSASTWGDVAAIDQWHKARGWSGCGYHAVILNGQRTAHSEYNSAIDGKIEPGRPETRVGAHCKADNMNAKALGVCLVGMPGQENYPTEKQIGALVHYLAVKCKQYRIPISAITQHSDHEPAKPHCASLNMADIRRRVAAKLAS